LAHELGDGPWAAVLAEHDRTIAEEVARHGGRVIKTLGDGALVAFDGARSALRTAVALQHAFADQPVSVRIGIHCGDVIHARDDVIGATVNKAARVTAAAAGGQIVVSSVTRELAGESDEFSYGEPFLAELKGIPGIHELVPLLPGGARREDTAIESRTAGE
jgi:adenylate cyclase